jgi:hypothetical protein
MNFSVPSRDWRQRDEALAIAAEALGVPAYPDLLVWADLPPSRQGELRNNDQRRDNVDGKMTLGEGARPRGGLLILDDFIGSGATLREAARVLRKGAVLGIDLVPDLPAWDEYANRVTFRGRNERTGAYVTLLESVRQDRRRRLTLFDQEYVERRGSKVSRRRFSLAFRTIPLPEMVALVERAGFRVTAVLGDYRGRDWDLRADCWLIMAQRCSARFSAVRPMLMQSSFSYADLMSAHCGGATCHAAVGFSMT